MGTNQPTSVKLDKEKDAQLDQHETFQKNQNQFNGSKNVKWLESVSDFTLNFDEEEETEEMTRGMDQNDESLRQEENHNMLWVEIVKKKKIGHRF